ncbi:multiprotein-bridging factor 1 family protein [Streptomyces sp. NPDC050516]|uniref:multiprotein-bridging factor 1 family protein n=1 Tax=Streptomyces sp. NPDC050516 TaxID=3365621 RepID=UPI0037B9BF34
MTGAPRPGGPATGELARLLRRKRIETGQSMRVLARRVGLSAHSPISDYEQGRRLPPPDLDRALESALEIPGGTLARLRREALAERAAAMLANDSAESPKPGEARVSAEPGGAPPRAQRRPRALLPVVPGAGLGGGAAPGLGLALGVPAALAVVILWGAARRAAR